MKSPFVKRGSVQIGTSFLSSWKAGWPWARITVDEDRIEIGGSIFFQRDYLFPATKIARLSIYDGMASRALRIEHSVAAYPPFVLFWSINFDALVASVRICGFRVEDL